METRPGRLNGERRWTVPAAAVVVAAALLACQSGAARAQMSEDSRSQLLDQFLAPDLPGVGVSPGVTVRSRLRQEYDPLGIRAGGFLIRPLASVRSGYDDNVLGTRNPRGSAFVQTSATLQASSNWSSDGLAAGLAVDDVRYLDTPQQSVTNWTASLGGFYEFGRDALLASYQHQTLNQTPRDLGVPLLDSTIQYRIDSVRIGYSLPINRLTLLPELGIANFSFDDGSVAGVPYPQRYRNRTVVTPGLVVRYELAPRRNLVGVVRNSIADYRRPLPGAVVRDYNDTAVLAGMDYDDGGLWRFRALVGYEVRTFTSSAFKTIQAPIAEASVTFIPSGLTTLNGTVARRIADSAAETTSGFTETAVSLSVDHEYLRNVLLRARGTVLYAEYNRGGGTQTLYSVGGGATWLLDRNLRLSANYDLAIRRSDASGTLGPTGANVPGQRFGGNYTESIYMLQLSVGL